jgi:large subunit ribosomal protein L5
MAKQADNKIMPLKEKYEKVVREELKSELGIENVMAIPNLEKIVINVGAGKAKDDSSIITEMEEIVAAISGQKPVITKAKIAVSNFKIREGMPIGLKVTLRRDRMWFFLDKLINITLPRTKDFRGVSYKSFDGKGNYSLGMDDQTIFPEVDTTRNHRLHGLQISIITTARDDESGYKLLEKLGFPFKKGSKFAK